MINYALVGTNDLDRARSFYDGVFMRSESWRAPATTSHRGCAPGSPRRPGTRRSESTR